MNDARGTQVEIGMIGVAALRAYGGAKAMAVEVVGFTPYYIRVKPVGSEYSRGYLLSPQGLIIVKEI